MTAAYKEKYKQHVNRIRYTRLPRKVFNYNPRGKRDTEHGKGGPQHFAESDQAHALSVQFKTRRK